MSHLAAWSEVVLTMTDVDELANDVVRARPAAKPLIELRAMTLQFAKQTILNNINLTIPRGQTVAIIGESGCGKTMLLKSVTGLLAPTSGSMLYDGVDIHSLGDVEMTRLRCKFGFVFQNAALFDSMTIGQNVAFPSFNITWPMARTLIGWSLRIG